MHKITFMRPLRNFLVCITLLFSSYLVCASPFVSIVIDDIGYNTQSAERIAKMKHKITCAVLPQAPSSVKAMDILIAADKEIMLHLPMQGREGEAQEIHMLRDDMSEEEFKTSLRYFMSLMPRSAGLNNHQGSILTKKAEAMDWLMEELKDVEDFYFIDSLTTKSSKGISSAKRHNVPYTVRDIFLDHIRDEAFVEKQFKYLIKLAKQQGHAIAIAHPYYQTLNTLKRLLPTLKKEGIELIYASDYISRVKMALKAQPQTQNFSSNIERTNKSVIANESDMTYPDHSPL